MPWKECHVMDERLRFVARLLEGEKMAPLCAEFGISRKTGYKIFDRYKDTGVTAFTTGVTAGVTAFTGPRCPGRPNRMRCGVPTTKASFFWAIASTATP